VAAADLDGDGDLDLAVADSGLTLFAGDGHGDLASLGAIAVPGGTRAVAIGDLDGDGDADLVAVRASVASVVAFLGDGSGGFVQASESAVGADPYDLLLGDFDADGKLDAATANYTERSVSRLLGDGQGHFGPATLMGVGQPLIALASADFDGNGIADIAAAQEATNNVVIFDSNGNGFWSYGGVLPTGVDGIADLAVGDVVEDGRPDLLVLGETRLSVLAADGAGGFLAAQAGGFISSKGISINPDGAELALLDVNGDGHLDAVLTSEQTSSLTVALGDGASLPACNGTQVLSGASWGLVVHDFDGDGNTDLAVASAGANNVKLLLGTGGGNFAAPVVTPVGITPRVLVDADFDGNGVPDLAVGCLGIEAVELLLGTGSNSFSVHGPFAVSGQPMSLVIADLDLDGDEDVASANALENHVGILFGDGAGNLTTHGNLNFPAAPSWMASGDVDSDGKPDLLVQVGGMKLLLGHGDGNFSSSDVALPAGVGSLAFADFDGDSLADLVGAGSNGLDLLAGDGAGGFGAPLHSNVDLPNAGRLVGADFDGDGRLDLAGSSNFVFFSTVIAVRNVGAGSFALNGQFTGPVLPSWPGTGDLDGDGAADFAITASQGPASVELLHNRRLDADYAWTDLGHGLAGAAGEARLVGSGTLQLASTGSLVLSHAAPSHPALLLLSTSVGAAAFKGGTLVPIPVLATVPLATDAAGGLALAWPTLHEGFSGLTLVAQYAIADAGAVHGVALSNGVSGLVP
jgi:hypothetical protein